MNKLTIVIIGLLVIVGGWFLVNKENTSSIDGTGVLELISGKDFDFGEILMTGGDVKTNYILKNTGDAPIRITKASTSCMCTTANVFDTEGKSVGEFGMGGAHGANPKIDLEIPAGAEIKVEATYDPLAHGPDAVGKLVREIFLDTDDGEMIRLKFTGIGVKELSNPNVQNENSFESISSAELETMLNDKDFLMIDVHTPEQEHIPGTDYMISYDEVEKIASKILSKDAKVVLYCRSGSMSKQTAKDLAEMGYTNIFELENGMNEWKAEKREVLPKGSVESL